MASKKGRDPVLGKSELLNESPEVLRIDEWPIPTVLRLNIANRNIGCACTINCQITFPSPSSLDVDRLTARVTKVQQLWPLLSINVVDQRTTKPKMQYRHTAWSPERIIINETYDASGDPHTDREAIYERAVRLSQLKTSFDLDPLWKIYLFRASSDPESHPLYFCLTLDHIIIDGRGTVNLIKALVAKDISKLPADDVKTYAKTGLGQDMDEPPPYSFVASAMAQGTVYPLLPTFMQKWLGQHPIWPQSISKPTIDTPWKVSILDIPSHVTKQLKSISQQHGIGSLNATLHAGWVVAMWMLFLRQDPAQAFRDITVKDLRDVERGDPYCMGGHPTMYTWSSGLLSSRTRFWDTALSYHNVSTDPRAHEEGTNMMRMLNMSKDGELNPDECKYRTQDGYPLGDKRAHTMHEERGLEKMNSLNPYAGLSGIWSNLSFVGLPEGATDLVIGCGGSATAPAFNAVLVGHENGTRVQSSFSDGAAMTEKDVKNLEKLYLEILKRVVAEDGDWLFGDFVDALSPIKAKL